MSENKALIQQLAHCEKHEFDEIVKSYLKEVYKLPCVVVMDGKNDGGIDMKVLMLQGYYEPEAVSGLYLVTNLVEDLNKNNHLVDIVTPIPSRGVSDEIRNEYKNNKKEVNSSGKTTIHRYWMPKEGTNSLLRAFRYLYGGILHVIKSIKI